MILINGYRQDKPLINWNKAQWERWINAPQLSKPIANTPFIIIKAPLSTSYETEYGLNSFTIDKLMNFCMDKCWEIKYVVNASLTSSFYHDTNEWKQWDIEYFELSGNKKFITSEDIDTFEKYCNNKEPLICLFDDYGCNNTILLVICYLIDILHVDIIDVFKKYKKTVHIKNKLFFPFYYDFLSKRYHTDIEKYFPIPSPPVWYGDINSQDDSDYKQLLLENNKNKTSSSSYPIFKLLPSPPFTLSISEEKTNEILNVYEKLTKFRTFCGTEVIEYNPNELNVGYWISFKSVGIRIQLFIYNNECFIIQSKDNSGSLNIISVYLNLPNLNNTLLEGILIEEKLKDNSSIQYKILLFDILYLNGECVYTQNMQNRINLIMSKIIEPQKKIDPKILSQDTVKIRFKDCFSLRKIDFLLNSVLPQVLHKTDGIIFLPSGKGSLRNDDSIKPMKWNESNESKDKMVLRIKGILKASGINV